MTGKIHMLRRLANCDGLPVRVLEEPEYLTCRDLCDIGMAKMNTGVGHRGKPMTFVSITAEGRNELMKNQEVNA